MAEAPTPPGGAATSATPRTPGASSTYCVSFKDTHSDVVVKTPVAPPRGDLPRLSLLDSRDRAVVGEDGRQYGHKVRLLQEEPDDILPAGG